MGARRAAERILDGVPSAIEWYPSEDRAALLREIGRHALRHLPAKFETWLVATTLKIFASRIHSIMSHQVANEETESGGGGGQTIYSERYVAFVDIFGFSSIVISYLTSSINRSTPSNLRETTLARDLWNSNGLPIVRLPATMQARGRSSASCALSMASALWALERTEGLRRCYG
jgi:hypothetical protein